MLYMYAEVISNHFLPFRNYIDLIGDSDPEYDRNYSPTPPPRSPITPTGTKLVYEKIFNG